MDRRSFLGTTGALVGTAAAGAAAGKGADIVAFDDKERVTYSDVAQKASPAALQRVYVLGGNPDGDKVNTTIRLMCDHVFDRLIKELEAESCQYYVSAGEKIGMYERFKKGPLGYEAMTLKHNYHTHYETSVSDAVSGVFPIDDFVEKTSRWASGYSLLPADQKTYSAIEAFGQGHSKGVVGQPPLPRGVMFAAHYVDTVTGMVMRAVAAYDMSHDRALMRFDVLVG